MNTSEKIKKTQQLLSRLLFCLELLAGFLSGMAVVSIWVGMPLALMVVGGGLGAGLVGWWRHLTPIADEPGDVGAFFPIWWPLLIGLFLLPTFLYPVAPGADAAMYAALARGVAEGGPELSPAWGEVTTTAYPRGLSALMALFGLALGYGRASLLGIFVSYSLYFLGTAHFFRATRTSQLNSWKAAAGWSLLTLMLFRCPQKFIGWGGSTTVAAYGLALMAGALCVRGQDRSSLAVAALLFAGAIATHPIGSLASLLAAVWLFVQAWREQRTPECIKRLLLRTLCSATTWLTMAVALSAWGPHVSEAEGKWILEFQSDRSTLFRLLDIWGYSGTILVCVAVALLTWKGARALVGRTFLWGLSLGLVLWVGSALPRVDLLIYPVRFTPLVCLAVGPVVAEAVGIWLTSRSVAQRRTRSIALLGVALCCHFDFIYPLRPLATFADSTAILQSEDDLPRDAVVAGSYGDGTQWIPALIGRRISRPHVHCTLFEEVGPVRGSWTVDYGFVGEQMQHDGPLDQGLIEIEPLVQVGNARMHRMKVPTEPGPPPWKL
jgi:hypothetical protein